MGGRFPSARTRAAAGRPSPSRRGRRGRRGPSRARSPALAPTATPQSAPAPLTAPSSNRASPERCQSASCKTRRARASASRRGSRRAARTRGSGRSPRPLSCHPRDRAPQAIRPAARTHRNGWMDLARICREVGMCREKRENQRTAAARRPGGINCSAAAASARLRAVQCGRMGVWGVLQRRRGR